MMVDNEKNTNTDENEPFDYGNKKSDGQFERYPINISEKPNQPVRYLYKHTKCKSITRMAKNIADTFAEKPKYYTHTFCGRCKDHLPVNEFVWIEDGKVTDLVVGEKNVK